MTKIEKGVGCAVIGLWGLYVLGVVSVIGGIVWVAKRFLRKVWRVRPPSEAELTAKEKP